MTDPSHAQPPDAIPVARPLSGHVPVARPVFPADATAAMSLPRDDLLLRKSSVGAAWIDVVRLIVLMLGVELLAGVLIAICLAFPGSEWSNDSDLTAGAASVRRALFVPMLTLRAVGVLAAVTIILRHRRQSIYSVGLIFSGMPLNLVLGVAACIVIYGLILIAMPLMFLAFPDVMEQMAENADVLMDAVPRLSTLGFAGLSLLIGVYEEVMFRGFLMTRLRRATGSWTLSVLLSTAVFTALHAIDQVSVALVLIATLSMVFSLVTIWRRSIIPAIVAHALFNFSQFCLMSWQAGDAWT